jgi:hypothetical protein
MIKELLGLIIAGSIIIACQACTYRAWYEGFRAQQWQDCYKIASQVE